MQGKQAKIVSPTQERAILRYLSPGRLARPPAYYIWLACLSQVSGIADGPIRAMALEVLAEWRLAEASQPFQHWLAQGAPSAAAP